jgi:hypothetical protein
VNGNRSARASLWEKALTLPLATDDDFFGNSGRPAGIDPQHLRVISDTALRSRLIMAGIAEGLQSPKGPQRIKSIIRLYPAFDAPRPGSAKPRAVRAAAPPAAQPPSRAAFGLPTVEELNALLNRIQQAEREVSHELQGRVTSDIDRLKKQIGSLDGDAFERAFRELENAMRQRRELAGQIREEAFRRVEADPAFEPRRYLRLLSRETSRQ